MMYSMYLVIAILMYSRPSLAHNVKFPTILVSYDSSSRIGRDFGVRHYQMHDGVCRTAFNLPGDYRQYDLINTKADCEYYCGPPENPDCRAWEFEPFDPPLHLPRPCRIFFSVVVMTDRPDEALERACNIYIEPDCMQLPAADIAVRFSFRGQTPDFYLPEHPATCYWRTNGRPATQNAETYCQNQHPGAHAVAIHSFPENQIVRQMCSGTSPWAHGTNRDPCTIGLYEKYTSTESFVWYDETEVDFDYWRHHQPDNHGGDESYVAMNKHGNNGEWDDFGDDQLFPVVCKVTLNYPTAAPSSATDDSAVGDTIRTTRSPSPSPEARMFFQVIAFAAAFRDILSDTSKEEDFKEECTDFMSRFGTSCNEVEEGEGNSILVTLRGPVQGLGLAVDDILNNGFKLPSFIQLYLTSQATDPPNVRFEIPLEFAFGERVSDPLTCLDECTNYLSLFLTAGAACTEVIANNVLVVEAPDATVFNIFDGGITTPSCFTLKRRSSTTTTTAESVPTNRRTEPATTVDPESGRDGKLSESDNQAQEIAANMDSTTTSENAYTDVLIVGLVCIALIICAGILTCGYIWSRHKQAQAGESHSFATAPDLEMEGDTSTRPKKNRMTNISSSEKTL